MFPQKGNIYFWELKILCFIITQSICPPTLSQRLEIKTPATDFSLTSQEHTCLCDNTSQAGLKASTTQSRRFSSAAENREIFLCPWKLPAYLHCADTYLGLRPDLNVLVSLMSCMLRFSLQRNLLAAVELLVTIYPSAVLRRWQVLLGFNTSSFTLIVLFSIYFWPAVAKKTLFSY